jgi:hypothetical protein
MERRRDTCHIVNEAGGRLPMNFEGNISVSIFGFIVNPIAGMGGAVGL